MIVRRQGDRLVAEWYGRPDCPPNPPCAYERLNGPVSLPSVNRIYRSRVPLLIGNASGLPASPCVIEFEEVRIYNRALAVGELP
jgi:hypothetical protein